MQSEVPPSTAQANQAWGIFPRKLPLQPWAQQPAAGISLLGREPERTPSEWLWDANCSALPMSAQYLENKGEQVGLSVCTELRGHTCMLCYDSKCPYSLLTNHYYCSSSNWYIVHKHLDNLPYNKHRKWKGNSKSVLKNDILAIFHGIIQYAYLSN